MALAACVFATGEVQDQEAAEQYYLTHGVYPSWYTYAGVRNVAYPAYGAYPYGAYGAYPYGFRYGAYPARAYGYGYSYGY